MSYYRAPAERPRQAKRFLTSREVEDMAAEGRTEIVHVDDIVITDAARETAHDLGIRIVRPEAKPPAAQVALEPAVSALYAQVAAVASAPVLVSGLVAQTASAYPGRALSSDPLVQAIVQAVRATKG